jgi:hypothetical protein
MRITTLILRGIEDGAELARKLDAFVRETTSILNGGVRLKDQLAAEIKTVRYVGGESLPILTRYTSKPATVAVLAASESQNVSATQSGNRVSWSYSDGFVTIADVDGLTASTDYVVTFAIVEA